jgi:hypothetical protein
MERGNRRSLLILPPVMSVELGWDCLDVKGAHFVVREADLTRRSIRLMTRGARLVARGHHWKSKALHLAHVPGLVVSGLSIY